MYTSTCPAVPPHPAPPRLGLEDMADDGGTQALSAVRLLEDDHPELGDGGGGGEGLATVAAAVHLSWGVPPHPPDGARRRRGGGGGCGGCGGALVSTSMVRGAVRTRMGRMGRRTAAAGRARVPLPLLVRSGVVLLRVAPRSFEDEGAPSLGGGAKDVGGVAPVKVRVEGG